MFGTVATQTMVQRCESYIKKVFQKSFGNMEFLWYNAGMIVNKRGHNGR